MEDRDANLRETAFDQTLPSDPGEVSIKGMYGYKINSLDEFMAF